MRTASFRTRLATSLGLFAVAACLALAAPARAAYLMTEISVPGAATTSVWDINNVGTMVGHSSSGAGTTAFVRSSGGDFTPLSGPSGATASTAAGISDGGVVVGSFFTGGGGGPGPALGFIYAGGAYTTFAVAGADDTFLRGISPEGRYFSGYYSTAAQAGVGFVYDSLTGVFSTLSVAGSQLTIAQGINSAGILVGSDVLGGPPVTRPGFLYDIATGTRTDVNLAGAEQTALRSIDDAGLLAGWYLDAANVAHGFVGAPASYETIDFAGAEATFVEGSNNARWLVGSYRDAAGLSHGFVAVPVQVPAPGMLALLLAAGLALPVHGRGFTRWRRAGCRAPR